MPSTTDLRTEIERLGRLYVASRSVSRAAADAGSRDQLFDEAVRVLVEVGKFAMALVAWHDPATKLLVPVARFGDSTGFADRIRMHCGDEPEEQDPVGAAFLTAKPYVCNDFLNDSRVQHWRDEVLRSGWRASAAFPIPVRGSPQGLLLVCAVDVGVFGTDQVELLQEVVLDVGHGLERLESEGLRRRTDATLLATELSLRLAMEAADIGTFEADVGTGKVSWDEKTRRMFGFEPGSLEGTYQTFQKCIHPDDLTGLSLALGAVLHSRGVVSEEFRIVRPDGTQRWIFGRGAFHYDEAGVASLMRGVALDYTDRKNSETALRTSEERLRQAVRAARIGIFDQDHASGNVDWSPYRFMVPYWGPENPLSTKSYFELVHPEDQERLAAAVALVYDPTGEGSLNIQHRLLPGDGTVRWVNLQAQTFFSAENGERRPVRTVGTIRDVTDQKNAEGELKKLAALVEMSRDFIGIATLDGRAVYVNDAGLNLVGLSREEIAGKAIFEFLDEGALDQGRDQMYGGVTKDGYWRGQSRLKHFRTGEPIDVEITAFPINDDHGAPLYLATVTRDLTESNRLGAQRKKLEGQLIQAQKMESIGRLAGGVAHDFNNMLTVILGYVALIKGSTPADSPNMGDLTEIEKAANRSKEITRQLLGFSRRQIIAPVPSNLNDLVADLQAPLGRLIGEDVEMAFYPGKELWKVVVDHSQVNQILLNLVVNARDAMPQGGKLTIETSNVEISEEYCRTQPGIVPGPHVLLAVSDNGEGMTAETASQIFEPFFTTKGCDKGTGLGLATVYGIVKQNQGCINVYSEPGVGTTFKIYIPRAEGEAVASDKKAVAGPAVPGTATILLVEDDPLVRKMTTHALKRLGYQLVVAETPQQALELCGVDSGVDLMLTDVIMPGMNGMELRDLVAAANPGIKTLFMSGYTSNVITNHDILKAAVNFIQKPFALDELARRVAETLTGEPGAVLAE